jgi:archaemetzincin
MAALFDRRRLELIPAGGVALGLLRWLGGELDAALGTCHRLLPALPPGLPGGDDADALLDQLVETHDGGEGLRLAVSGGTLRSPAGAVVHGVAAVGHGCAVVGCAPLCATSDCSDRLSLDRTLKVCIHELAHAAGVEHCADPVCVMHPSRSLGDTDRKARGFCARCARRHAHATLDGARG